MHAWPRASSLPQEEPKKASAVTAAFGRRVRSGCSASMKVGASKTAALRIVACSEERATSAAATSMPVSDLRAMHTRFTEPASEPNSSLDVGTFSLAARSKKRPRPATALRCDCDMSSIAQCSTCQRASSPVHHSSKTGFALKAASSLSAASSSAASTGAKGLMRVAVRPSLRNLVCSSASSLRRAWIRLSLSAADDMENRDQPAPASSRVVAGLHHLIFEKFKTPVTKHAHGIS